MKFSANESPEKWSYKMQMLLDMCKQLNDAFKLTLKPAAFFLGNNVTVHDGAQGGAP